MDEDLCSRERCWLHVKAARLDGFQATSSKAGEEERGRWDSEYVDLASRGSVILQFCDWTPTRAARKKTRDDERRIAED
jgi:hypothetical protein